MTNATTTTMTTTTNKNFSRVLYGVTNQVAQKLGLNSEAKKQVTDFVSHIIRDEIKTVFPATLPEGLEATSIPFENKVILLAYEKCQGKDVLYACLQEKPVEEVLIKEKEVKTFVPKRQLSDMDRDKIITGTVGRVKSLLRGYVNISIDSWTETQIFNFLNQNQVNGRIGVLITRRIPEGESYSKTQIRMKEYNLNLVYGVNPVENDYPYIIWVMAEKSQEAQQREAMALKEKRLRNIWESKRLAKELLDEVLQKIDLKSPITITVYGSAGEWNRDRKNKKEIVFIGQTPDPKTGNFVPNRPIGYISGNSVVITAPGNSGKFICQV